MALYLDTSCLLKLVFPEPESARVSILCAAEEKVVVSSLCLLEATVQINARRAGGALTRTVATRLRKHIDTVLTLAPYELVAFPLGAVEAAGEQLRSVSTAVHCRTLDRLHLAVMEILGLRRILTNDDPQGRAAVALGYEVVRPR